MSPDRKGVGASRASKVVMPGVLDADLEVMSLGEFHSRDDMCCFADIDIQ